MDEVEPEEKEVLEDMVKVAQELGPEPDHEAPVLPDDPYPEYDQNTSRVVSGPLGIAKFPGTRYPNWREAERETREKFSVFRFWTFGQRWYARVKR